MGFEMAMEELTLVLFTTIAPSGAIAVALMAALAVAVRGDGEARARIDQRLWLPIAITLVGLVASATHLGNPANALYVLLGVGSSPLSNEVASAVVFLGLAGLYWLTAFSRRDLRLARNVLACGIVLASVAFVTAVAFAYDAVTIQTWHTPFVPASLWLNALCGGPLLALVTLRWACPDHAGGAVRAVALAVSAVGLGGSVVAYALQNGVLSHAANAMATGPELVPHYSAMIAAFAVLAAAGWVFVALRPRKGAQVMAESVPTSAANWRAHAADAVGCLLVFAGIFTARFAFYMMHLTV